VAGNGTLSGDRIRAARERAGLTQQQLAALVDVSARTVGNWERGETVPMNRFAKVRQVLGIPDDAEVVYSRPEPSLEGASDAQLIAELAKRLSRGHPRAVE
jgi:transcriptional regulator with XRE-family HTH domain